MNWYEFVFSGKLAHRIMRHTAFWLLWWVYFAATYYYYLQVGLQQITFGNLSSILLIKTFLLIIIHFVACYCFIYIFLPRYLLTRKHFMLITGIVFLIAFLMIAGYGMHLAVFPLIDLAYHRNFLGGNSIWWTNINSVLLNAPKVIAAATAIKLVKYWYLKQKEKELLEKEKLITDLQLMKAQIRPDFLFSSLDHIYESAQRKLPEAPELLIKLADLLSYLLYDCDEPKVSLEKELVMMKEYIALEKVRYRNKLDVQIVIKGDALNKNIAPLLLLPFIENSFKHCSQSERPWINLEFNVEKEILSMKLINGLSLANTDSGMHDTTTVEKRLQLLYEEKYELKQYAEEEIYVVLLKINLSEKSILKSSTYFKNVNGKDLKNEYVGK